MITALPPFRGVLPRDPLTRSTVVNPPSATVHANERRSKASLAALAPADAVFEFTALMERTLEKLSV
jgi:hypothetical protein